MNNLLWNMISNIKNNQLARKQVMFQKKNSVCIEILNILWDEGFILGYTKCHLNSNFIKIFLNYKKKTPVISSLVVLTKPSSSFYYSTKQLWKLNISNGLMILSTSKGFMTIETCKKLNLGGKPFFIIK
uniref:Ribosomal protein S8 n=1 Tax=Lithodesmium undulatum TaxID=59812 RepID=A0A7T7A9S0_LITUN|nr:ribosomal protein S8 [Lithodesmium undulatum]QQJ94644.1 ribosomal protein S8 [Lithodesmium undulatum]